MESRTIDIAKTASIDMMTLNNKVVNMRQVVKRTKVHVISKLCKHIHALKKKQGTEEQKAKNLRKAQRFIEEIDSIKKLKEDKVSKYALANTSSFGDVSKMSLLPGARALARLADHALMKKVVTNFRDQHTDWRDLAAYLLVKQTGRRFKTKKQKQKKLARCIENMNASEVMTKAYIQERFGQEGLAKAEQTFERKRKRRKSVVSGNHSDSKHGSHTDSRKKKKHETEITHSEGNGIGDLIENMQPQKEMSKNNDACSKNIQTMIKESENGSLGTDMCNQNELQEGNQQKSLGVEYDHSDNSDIERETAHCHRSPERDEIPSAENIKHSSKIVDSTDQVTLISDKYISSVDTLETVQVKTKLQNECVVKELRLEGTDVVVVGGDDEQADSASESDSNTYQHSSQSSGHNGDDKDKYNTHQKQVPGFLTRANKTVISDPFFAGSEEELELDVDSTMKAAVYASDDDNTDVDMSLDPVQAKSMFYHPGPHRQRGTSMGRFRRGWGDRYNSETRDAPGRFDTRQRDRTAIDNRGRTFRGGNRDRTFRGVSQGNGSFRAPDKKFTSKQTLDKHDSRGGWRGAGTHTRAHRSIGGTAADLQISHTVPTASPAPEKLHPSWEASKKRRAEQSGITTFQGSKLTFDDDD